MGLRGGGAPFLSDRWSDTLMSQKQLSRLTPFSVDWPIRETFAHCDFPYLRRKIDRGAPLDTRQIEDVWRANDACLDALYRIGGDSPATVWLPGVEEGEARRMLGRAMVEQMTADNPTIEIVRKGAE